MPRVARNAARSTIKILERHRHRCPVCGSRLHGYCSGAPGRSVVVLRRAVALAPVADRTEDAASPAHDQGAPLKFGDRARCSRFYVSLRVASVALGPRLQVVPLSSLMRLRHDVGVVLTAHVAW